MTAPAPKRLPAPSPGILAIEPYVGGDSSVPGRNRIFKLSSNESPLGPSPRAIEAYRSVAADLARYPAGDADELRAALAQRHGFPASQITVGAGSDEILHLIAQAYLGPGDEAIFTEHAFLVYRIVTLAANARPVIAPEKNCRADVDAILSRVTSRTKLVFLANPNNPTGSYLSRDELAHLHGALPPDILLVIDAAYAEYVGAANYSAGSELVAEFGNVVMTRTFSKAYGLAGLRLGWAYCPPHVRGVLERIRGPFNTSVPAQAAGQAALEDRAHLERAVAHNARWLGELGVGLRALDLKVLPSAGNFLLIDFGSSRAMRTADAALREAGLILRGVTNYGFDSALRLSVGPDEANRAVLDTLANWAAGAQK
jgi:histidinol-phosphate aminotransferase